MSLPDVSLGDLLGLFGSIYSSNQAAGAAQQAGQQAAQASQFRPVGVTTRFGRSGFEYGPGGELIGAGYQAAPDVAAMREALLGIGGGALQQAQFQQGMQPTFQQQAGMLQGLAGSFLPQGYNYAPSAQATGLAGMLRSQAGMAAPTSFAAAPTAAAQGYAGQLQGMAAAAAPTSFAATASPEAQALYQQLSGTAQQLMPTSTDTQAAAQRYTQQQQALLAPQREQQLAGVRNRLFQTGRSGLATGATAAGDMAATNPEMAAYYNSIAQQNAQIAASAEQQARQNMMQDIGLSSQLGTSALGQLQQSQQQALQNALTRGQFGAGLLGTAYGATSQSEQQALQNALARGQFASQQATSALSAEQQAEELSRRRLLEGLQVGTGLFGQAGSLLGQGYGLQQQALAPFTGAFGAATGVEQQALNPLTLGAGLGSQASAAAMQAAQLQMQGQQQANAINAGTRSTAINQLADPVTALINKLIGGGP